MCGLVVPRSAVVSGVSTSTETVPGTKFDPSHLSKSSLVGATVLVSTSANTSMLSVGCTAESAVTPCVAVAKSVDALVAAVPKPLTSVLLNVTAPVRPATDWTGAWPIRFAMVVLFDTGVAPLGSTVTASMSVPVRVGKASAGNKSVNFLLAIILNSWCA